MTEKEQKYYERIKSHFIGQKIKEVYYEELDYGSDCEYWELSDEIHSVDMNVILKLENHQLLQIKWDNEFYPYGVGFANISKITVKKGFKIINVSNHSNWKRFIGKTIYGINIFWDTSESAPVCSYGKQVFKKEKSITKLPQTWEFNIENTKVWIATLEIYDEKRIIFWADHLSVFFSKRAQEKIQLLQNTHSQHYITL